MMLLATAWLPYMMVCCVVDPFADSSGAQPDCHILAGISPAAADASAHSAHAGDHHGADHGSTGHHGDSKGSHDGAPAHSCCDLTGKTNVTIDKGLDFTAQPGLITVTYQFPDLVFPERSSLSAELVDPHEHSPPIYLRNASFLI